MELFEVFVKIVVNAEEINKKLDKIMTALKKFADSCKEVIDKCSSAFDRMRETISSVISVFAEKTVLQG